MIKFKRFIDHIDGRKILMPDKDKILDSENAKINEKEAKHIQKETVSIQASSFKEEQLEKIIDQAFLTNPKSALETANNGSLKKIAKPSKADFEKESNHSKENQTIFSKPDNEIAFTIDDEEEAIKASPEDSVKIEISEMDHQKIDQSEQALLEEEIPEEINQEDPKKDSSMILSETVVDHSELNADNKKRIENMMDILADKGDILSEKKSTVASIDDEPSTVDQLLEKEDQSTTSKENMPFDLKKRKQKKVAIIIGSIILALGLLYLGCVYFFTSHFIFNSTINGMNVALNNAEDAAALMDENIAQYTMTLTERNDQTETITPEQINLVFKEKDAIPEMIQNQKKWQWPLSLFPGKVESVHSTFVFDEDELNDTVDALAAVSGEGVVKVVDAHTTYQDGQFVIVPETEGTQVDVETFKEKLTEAISQGETTFDLDQEGCYIAPKYRQDNQTLIDTVNTLNNTYLKTTITYTLDTQTETLTKETFAPWITIDGNLAISINKDQVLAYADTLGEEYNTNGISRPFTTSYGANITVNAGNYGFVIDSDGEADQIMADIATGQTISREPVYTSTAVSRDAKDYGNSYVEISITGQTLWVYIDGQQVVTTPITSGTAGSHDTPTGVYAITYKTKDAVLQGEDYASPVSYWVPFNGDIGIHDASWRSNYGGSVYLTSGSHGCINTPVSVMGTVYANVYTGMPVIVY